MHSKTEKMTEEQLNKMKLYWIAGMLPWMEVAIMSLMEKNEIEFPDQKKCSCGFFVKDIWNYCPHCGKEN